MPESISFTKGDRSQIGHFLESEAGYKLIRHLELTTPKCTGDSSEETLQNANRSQGWRDCIDKIMEITSLKPNQPEDVQTDV